MDQLISDTAVVISIKEEPLEELCDSELMTLEPLTAPRRARPPLHIADASRSWVLTANSLSSQPFHSA